tara:strand:- start:53 stop:646 length:594 start_codon:yes stop_codon:yes gene_type:complete
MGRLLVLPADETVLPTTAAGRKRARLQQQQHAELALELELEREPPPPRRQQRTQEPQQAIGAGASASDVASVSSTDSFFPGVDSVAHSRSLPSIPSAARRSGSDSTGTSSGISIAYSHSASSYTESEHERRERIEARLAATEPRDMLDSKHDNEKAFETMSANDQYLLWMAKAEKMSKGRQEGKAARSTSGPAVALS